MSSKSDTTVRWCAVRAGSIRARRGEPPSRSWTAIAARLDTSTHRLVMPGLVPGIHALGRESDQRRRWHRNSGLPEFRTYEFASRINLTESLGRGGGLLRIKYWRRLAFLA